MADPRKYTEAQKQSAKKWDAANLDRLSIALPKGQKDIIKAHAAERGASVNAFIGRAIECQMERDKKEAGEWSPAFALQQPCNKMATEIEDIFREI